MSPNKNRWSHTKKQNKLENTTIGKKTKLHFNSRTPGKLTRQIEKFGQKRFRQCFTSLTQEWGVSPEVASASHQTLQTVLPAATPTQELVFTPNPISAMPPLISVKHTQYKSTLSCLVIYKIIFHYLYLGKGKTILTMKYPLLQFYFY